MSWFKQRKMLEAGSSAPDFQLPSMGGEATSLRDILAAGPALLAFYKASCPVCQFTFPFLERIAKGGLRVFAVSQDDARSSRGFNQDYGISFPTLLDEAGKGYPVSNAFGISVVPSLFLVEPDGRISQAVSGFSKQDLEALGRRAGVAPFKADEYVPEWQAG